MNLYYEVMHKMEFTEFSHRILKGKISTNKREIIKELKEFLLNETDNQWEILMEYQEKITSVYDSLINKLKQSDRWEKVQKHFPDSDISVVSK